MRMIEIDYDAQPPVDSYGPGGFRVDGAWHEGSLLLLPSGRQTLAGVPGLESLAPVLEAAAELDLVIVGQGTEIAPLERAARAALEAAGIGIEVMSTPSACRTYNVLLTEDRRVALAAVAV